MAKLFEDTCSRCGGIGYVMHGNVTFVVAGREDRHCFTCNGTGKEFFKTSPEQREKNREAARKRREAKRIAEIEAREAKERAENNGRTIKEIREEQIKQREEARKAEHAQSQWIGELNEKVSIIGECLFTTTYQGYYGYNSFFIIKTESGDIVKFSTTSQTFDSVSKGDTVEMTGKVKTHEINEDRDDQKVTTLSHVKCQDSYTIRDGEAA